MRHVTIAIFLPMKLAWPKILEVTVVQLSSLVQARIESYVNR